MIVALEFIKCLMLVSPYYVGNVLFRMNIANLGSWIVLHNEIADRLNQVSFPQSDTSIDEEGVIGNTGTLRDLNSPGTRQLVCFSCDESVEGERGIQPGRSEERRVGKECSSR